MRKERAEVLRSRVLPLSYCSSPGDFCHEGCPVTKCSDARSVFLRSSLVTADDFGLTACHNLCHARHVSDESRDKDEFADLRSTETGRRLLAAEEALRLISAGKLPNVERVVCRAVFNTRSVSDSLAFEKIEGSNPGRGALLKCSEQTALLAMNLTGIPQATLFYPRDSSLNETHLFSAYFPKLISMMYAAIGLDVEHAADIDQETLDKLLRQGLPKVDQSKNDKA